MHMSSACDIKHGLCVCGACVSYWPVGPERSDSGQRQNRFLSPSQAYWETIKVPCHTQPCTYIKQASCRHSKHTIHTDTFLCPVNPPTPCLLPRSWFWLQFTVRVSGRNMPAFTVFSPPPPLPQHPAYTYALTSTHTYLLPLDSSGGNQATVHSSKRVQTAAALSCVANTDQDSRCIPGWRVTWQLGGLG
jgi:hypothetical protein